MKAIVMLLLGAAIGVLVAINLFPGKNRPGPLGNTTLMVRTGGDTVIINSKSDTIVINAKKDTIIINAYSEYCNRIPRPRDCPPLKVDTVVVK